MAWELWELGRKAKWWKNKREKEERKERKGEGKRKRDSGMVSVEEAGDGKDGE